MLGRGRRRRDPVCEVAGINGIQTNQVVHLVAA